MIGYPIYTDPNVASLASGGDVIAWWPEWMPVLLFMCGLLR